MTCQVYWGSHGCSRPPGHEGDHECGGEIGCGMTIDQRGDDGTGFLWDLYGADSPTELAELEEWLSGRSD